MCVLCECGCVCVCVLYVVTKHNFRQTLTNYILARSHALSHVCTCMHTVPFKCDGSISLHSNTLCLWACWTNVHTIAHLLASMYVAVVFLNAWLHVGDTYSFDTAPHLEPLWLRSCSYCCTVCVCDLMCVCMCVCVCAYIHVHVYVYMLYIHVLCMCVCVCVSDIWTCSVENVPTVQ